MDLARYYTPGRAGRCRREARGMSVEVGEERLRVEVLRGDLLRLSLSRAGRFDERPTFATAFVLPATVPFALRETPETIELETASLRLRIERPELCLSAERSDGTFVFESARDERGRSLAYVTLNDAFAVGRRRARGDALFGLGQKTGRFERTGRRFLLWNTDVLAPGVLKTNRLDVPNQDESGESTTFDPYYSSTPFFQHARRSLGDGGERLRAAGFFFDNGWPAEFDFRDDDALFVRFEGGTYTEYVFVGPELGAILEGYTFLTGRPHFPPLWSLGHHQCRWHDYTDAELVAIGREYRTRKIPCDALWLDIGHMDGHRVFTFHPERFPDPRGTFSALEADGFRTVTIVDPGVKIEEGFPIFESGREHGIFAKTRAGTIYEGLAWPGRTAFPDFVTEKTRAFWSELVARHAAHGVGGIWNDMNEPATGAIEPFAMRFDRDGADDPHERWHNQYALLMALATREGLARARPGERPFILSRAGFAGIQRLAAQWLGDHSATFEHLRMGLPMALGMGISGQPFVGADVPGFAGEATPELAARWFAYAALTPFCRCHHQMGSGPHYPWSFGPEVENVARAALELRYRLLPYLYTAFRLSVETGAPVQRPLVFDFQHDRRAAEIDDEYMLGDALLVAPLLEPEKPARTAYLPPGGFVDWFSKAAHAGPTEVEARAPFELCPLYVRGGAVIPMLEKAPATTIGFSPELIELHVFVPAGDLRRASILYEDDGLTFAHAGGSFFWTILDLERNGDALTLDASVRGAGFPEFRRRRFRIVFANVTPSEVRLNDDELLLTDGAVVIENRGQPFHLTARL